MSNWWKDAVVYQIYPRSFQDSNGDGIGDIRGIINRLDYLALLGVDAIWLSPVYKSPQVDNGYDVADYYDIDPIYGDMSEMEELIEKAKARNIKIIMDLVVNHTSDQNSWFIEAKNNPESEKRDFYIWHDPVDGHEPNGLTSGFSGGSAWTFDEKSGQYYLHLFANEQPDLNWENEKLRHAVYDMMNFWLDKGIGGFRMDVIDMIGKEPLNNILVNGPHLHEYLHEMNRATFGKGDYLTVGEAWNAGPDLARKYSAVENEELSMIFQFGHMWADRIVGGQKWETKPLELKNLKSALYENQIEMADSGWPALFWNNHDLNRVISRFGNEKNAELSGKMLAILLHGLRGTPYIYQGEEIGMTDIKVSSIDEVNDVEARSIYRGLVEQGIGEEEALRRVNIFSRDNARTPMQWDATKTAGFTAGQPWLEINPNHEQINVVSSLNDPNSLFWTYRKLIDLRHRNQTIKQGQFIAIESVPEQVFAYKRKLDEDEILVLVNFTDEEVKVDLPEIEVKQSLIGNYSDYPTELNDYTLRPYESMIVSCK